MPDLTAVVACGALTFEVWCSSCHGPDGLGSERGPSLASSVPLLADDALVLVITEGIGDMPGSPLGNQELADLVGWLRETF